MKTFSIIIIALLFAGINVAEAQFRSNIPSGHDFTGPVTQTEQSSFADFLGLKDFRMDHSYSMSVGSFGGDMYNQNMYTNTMHLLFNERLYGRVDLAMSHSPFGPGIMGQDGADFFVKNAELNYNISDNTHIRLSFQQNPHGFGYGGYGYSPFMSPYHRPHQRSYFHDRSRFGW